MAVPIPYFNFIANNLNVIFINKTTDGTSYLWDFGFKVGGLESTSTEENPEILFPNAGIFPVKLTATNTDGSSSFNFQILLSDTPNLNLTISQMVLFELPNAIPNMDIYYSQLVKKWQLYLQKSQGISDADVFDETKWPPTVNTLIAKLIVFDLTLVAQKAITVSSSSGGSISGSKGPVKRIETGPSNVEWFDVSTFWTNILKSGIMGNMEKEICMYAGLLGIRFSFCPKLKGTTIFITGHKNNNCKC